MVGGFFPTPYPDECYYSILCRYFVRSGSAGYKPTVKKLFGNMQCLSTAIFFPMRLDCVERWIPKGTAITRKTIAMNHTMYPYLSMVYSEKFRREMVHVLSSKKTQMNIDLYGRQRSWRLWPEYLRYCPHCVCEDKNLYGEPYWHRVHQLPGMVYCTKHRVRLMDSVVSARATTTAFYAASEQSLSEYDNSSTPDVYSRYKELFLRIGQESEWLLHHGMDIDWQFNFREKYMRLLREKDAATVQGVPDYDLISRHFNKYWGEEFLEILYTALNDTRDCVQGLREARLTTFRPIYHILMMCFLKGSVKEFVECKVSENPFGNGPWPCQNPICMHYGTNTCQNSDLRYVNGVATGFFHCEQCGMIYKQIRRKGKTGQILIVEYGSIWKTEMLRLLGTEKMTAPEAAKILKCSPSAIRWQKKKIGLTKKRTHVRRPPPYSPDVGPENYYKELVLKFCKEYGEVMPTVLRRHAPGAYSYLCKNDYVWLREHMVYKRDLAEYRKQDYEMLKKVQSAYEQIRKGGDSEKRITRGYIAKIAGLGKNTLVAGALKKPRTKIFIDSVIESKEDWLRRRITMIWEKQNGVPISLVDIKREMSLHPNTFVEYKDFLKELMDELNDKTE
ncbi:TnsD family Tn7-like transposition protein [Desulfosporosinus lacus]|uniref:TniQ protein n=1 Tax=Desulfosporosinus lacus DSM 15449 TaxID=1121420 RepID=A0A1M5UZD5_9FIRM|nr:TnsD family Tn7-like transposition protein [Desulfosporosinus lacus]SHH68329.1 TniQ protein [Desulfosporosinus lacus DSM 15449]